MSVKSIPASSWFVEGYGYLIYNGVPNEQMIERYELEQFLSAQQHPKEMHSAMAGEFSSFVKH